VIAMKSVLVFLFLLCACVQAEEKLTLGSKAPPIDIEHWLNREPVKAWEAGKVYVVEFWATWCGPCVASMPHLAEVQEKYGKDLVVIGVSDEDTDTIDEFLGREKGGKTFKEITDSYWLATDPDKSVYKDYMTASGKGGIPTAFVIGKTGNIEWIGHPSSIDEPVARIIDGTWNREAYLAFQAEQVERARRVQHAANQDLLCMALRHLSVGDRVTIPVTGKNAGSVWGDNLYTLDSDPRAAAVHAGLLKIGETKPVEFWIVPSPNSYPASESNGIKTQKWGRYKAAYMMRLASSVREPPLSPSAVRGGRTRSTEGRTFAFQPGDRSSRLAPRISPKGTQVELTPANLEGVKGHDHLIGRIALGMREFRGDGQLFAVGRTEVGDPYDLLVIDTDLDGDLGDEEPITTKPRITRDKWWSSFDGILKAIHAKPPQGAVDYPVSFWLVVEKPDETPSMIRYSRRGFVVGTTTVDGTDFTVLVSDANNDGVLGKGDFWRIESGESQPDPAWRNLPDFCWAAGKAWQLEVNDTACRSGTLREFDPGKSQAEDEVARDPYKVDRDAPRAANPVHFEHDFEAALAKAAATSRPCYLKFETDWCGPCKTMSQFVFTAKEVVTAAEGIVCVTVDGDKRKDLVQKYGVGGFPTGVMVDSTGKELGRTNGYQSVKKMSAFFLEHR